MSASYYRNGGCSGCGRSSYGRSNHGSCGCCQPSNNGELDCRFLGPFRAVDADCIIRPANTGSIIPFASGAPVALAAVAGGLVTTGAIVGFGTAFPAVPITLAGTTIDLTGLLFNEAFSVPRTGAVTAISASFTTTVALAALAGTATINAQIYRAPAGSNVFTATGATVDLAPTITGVALPIGTTFSGTSSNFAPVPVAPGDRLLMVFTVRGTVVIAALVGTASAGITIA